MDPVAVVFDTNVLISALGFGGTPLEALLRAFDDDLQLVVSEETLGKLERVMEYSRLPFTDADREEFLTILRREADIVNPSEDISEIESDPDDDMFLECAWDGDHYTVTYLQWNDHEWTPTRTVQPGTLGSFSIRGDQRGVSKPASSQPGRRLAGSPTEESPSL